MREGEGVSQEKKKGEKSVNSSEGKQGEEGDCSNGGELSEATRAAWSLVSQPAATAVVDQVGFFTATLAAACPAKVPRRPQENVLRIPHGRQQCTAQGRDRSILWTGPPTIFPDPSASQEPSETLFGSGGQAGPWRQSP